MGIKIVRSENIGQKYYDWTKELVEQFRLYIEDKSGKKFTIDKPMHTIYILNKSDFLRFRDIFQNGRRNIEPDIGSYKSLSKLSNSEIKHFYKEQPAVINEAGPAFWMRQDRVLDIGESRKLLPNEGYIFICPELFNELYEKIKNNMFDINQMEDIEYRLFKIILFHEIGHHFSFINLSDDQYNMLIKDEDNNMSEGIANYFALQACSEDEKLILAENAKNQRLCYRYYLLLRYGNMSVLLDKLINERDLIGTIKLFSEMVGPKLNINGHMMTTSFVDGIMMDWSGNGGKIIAYDYIEALGPWASGCFISPQIKVQFGRIPNNVLIFTNEIVRLDDYNDYPPNIIVKSKDEVDIHGIIKTNIDLGLKNDDLFWAVLNDMGMVDKWNELNSESQKK